MANRGVLTLLQFTALVLPAIAIYLDFVYGGVDLDNPKEEDVEVLEGEIHRGRLSVLFLVLGGGILLLQALIGVPSAYESMIGGDSCSRSLAFGICSSTILSTVSSLFLLIGLGMFGFLVAFGSTARQTNTDIIWGAVDVINQLNPWANSREDRIFQPDNTSVFSLLAILGLCLVTVVVSLSIVSTSSQVGLTIIAFVAGGSASVSGIIVAGYYEICRIPNNVNNVTEEE
jgi:hypothetical protein